MKITDKMIKASCSSTVYKRGMEYFKEGRVHLRRREEGLLTAVVDGGSIYSVEVEFNEREITRSFCTCPYNQTMHTVCKHIVAVMRQRRAETEDGGYADENDILAMRLCNSFLTMTAPKKEMRLKFKMYISSLPDGISYSASVLNEFGTEINGIENFLEAYSRNKPFKLDKGVEFVPGVSDFTKNTREILSVLCESYLNKSSGKSFYSKAVYQTVFGERTAARLLEYVGEAELSLIFNGVQLSDINIYDEDPDILIDVFATDEDITLFVSERGAAFTADCEWFFFDGGLYRTSPEWRRRYAPIYNALAEQNRTQITFKGAQRIMFAKYVLPEIKQCKDVNMQGIDEIIIDKTPEFGVYFDSARGNITAVVIARYGDITLRLPAKEEYGDKIVIRDFNREKEVLDKLSGFEYSRGIYSLRDGDMIFSFFKDTFDSLREIAEVKTSRSFDNLFLPKENKFFAEADFNKSSGLLEVNFKTELSEKEVSEILASIRLKRPFYRFSDGHFLDFSDAKSSRIFKIISGLDFSDKDIENGKKTLPKYYALYLESAEDLKKSSSFKAFLKEMRETKANIPKELENVLREYQKTGINWLKQLSYMDFGGILADDMGLGKTLQVLAFVRAEKPETPALVITPSALTYNWQNEITRFIPDAKSVIIDGSKEERKRLIAEISEYEFAITSYPLLRRDISLYKDMRFDCMFIDEAQNIKNEKTLNAHAVKQINAKFKAAITGTPIENSLSELWSVFDYIMPGYLGSNRSFNSRYNIPIAKEGNDEAARELKKKISPFIMRRMKSEVLKELPEKIEETIYADLTQPQKNMYAAFLAAAKDETLSLIGSGSRLKILALLMRLRQICCHPSLFDKNYTKDSGKLNLLLSITETALAGNHRLLIFSQFTSMLDIIQSNLEKRNISYFRIDGKTPSDERAETSERFNSGERDIFLISLKAGGYGLNLVGADMVIHYDPWWNPAVTDQATDRAYRIGQNRSVQVIRLASKGTIEEKILKLQDEKRALAEDIITTGNKMLKNLTDEEIMSLLE